MSQVTTAFLTAILLAAPAAAQRQPPVQQGARVRFTVLGSRSTWNGNVLPSSSDSLVVEYPGGDVFRVAVRQLESLQVSGGKQSMTIESSVLGAVLGAGIGALIERSKERECVSYDTWFLGTYCDEWVEPERRYWRVGSLVGLAGAIVGAVVGSKRTMERWISVPLDFRLP